MPTREELAKAIQILKAHDRDVEATETSLEGGVVIPVDGIPRTPQEICHMAEQIEKRS